MTAVIKYDHKVKNFIDELSATGHVSHRSYKKKSVTLHHNGGRLSHEGVLNVWKTRPASAHFDVDKRGDVCQYVKVNEYAWAAGNTQGNQESIHIEMANLNTGGNWEVAPVTWKAAARLAGWLFAKVIGSRPTKGNLFYHHKWNPTQCAGPYMDRVYSQVLAEAQRAYDYFSGVSAPPRPAQPARASSKSSTQLAAEIWAGKWGGHAERTVRLKAAGYNPEYLQGLVNKGVGRYAAAPKPVAHKTISDLAREVVAGKWGSGPERRARLVKAGYNPNSVQDAVNKLV